MSDSNYTDVSEFIPNWNPRTTGSTKNNDLVRLNATPESWVEGYYIGSREQVINNFTYTIHKIKVIAVGNPAHLGEPLTEKGKEYEFFGTGVVNTLLAEKIEPGMCVKIQWLGLQQPKKEGGQTYQGWKVLINNSVAPIAVQNGVVVGDSTSSSQGAAAGASAPVQQAQAQPQAAVPEIAEGPDTFIAEGDDDLPF